jgi:hypothetical protein
MSHPAKRRQVAHRLPVVLASYFSRAQLFALLALRFGAVRTPLIHSAKCGGSIVQGRTWSAEEWKKQFAGN